MADSTLDARKAALTARIRAAQARLEASSEGPGMGALLSELNDEVDAIAHEDRDQAQRAYDRIEARLAAERIREEDDAEEEDR